MRESIKPTDHAVQRYQERVKPALTLEAAREDLERFLPMATIVDAPPWPMCDDHDDQARVWAMLGDGICLPCVEDAAGRGHLVALSVTTHRGISDATRTKRNAAKSAQRAARKRHRRKQLARQREKHQRRADAA